MSKKQQLIEAVNEYYTKGVYKKEYPNEFKEYLAKVFKALWEPKLTAVDIGETHATIKYWENKGYLLMPVYKEVGDWRKFTFVELYWILLLRKFASMGCSLDLIVPKLVNAYQHIFETNKEISFDNPLNTPDSTNLNKELVFNFFGHVISVLMSLEGKYSIHIFENSFLFSSEQRMDRANAVEIAYKTLFRNCISVSISDTIYMNNRIDGFVRFLMRENVFNSQEVEIINLLQNNELKQLNIKLSNGKVVLMELTEKFDIKREEASKRLIQFINSPYQEIRAVTNGGNTISIERTTKKK